MTRLLARLLIVVPMLWVVSPWHVMNHQTTRSDTGSAHVHEAETGFVKSGQLTIDGSGTEFDEPDFAEGAPHCDSGPCAASVDMGDKFVGMKLASRYAAFHEQRSGVPEPPLTRPPRLSPAAG